MLTRGAAMPRAIDYAMSKAALDVMTLALAKLLAHVRAAVPLHVCAAVRAF
ncbi:hypothetical protein [Actinomadura logoneensis]|uniref:hypothetical protein n=1 Tax=Actinomadura logoneensis TaxID=2293572 RepID=UPI0018F254F1|nr:hypothetical protein [Actinomadura logoneensis]